METPNHWTSAKSGRSQYCLLLYSTDSLLLFQWSIYHHLTIYVDILVNQWKLVFYATEGRPNSKQLPTQLRYFQKVYDDHRQQAHRQVRKFDALIKEHIRSLNYFVRRWGWKFYFRSWPKIVNSNFLLHINI